VGVPVSGIGAILAVPLTLLMLILMENFEAHAPGNPVRYTGEEKKRGRQEAARNIQGLWGRAKETFSSEGSRRIRMVDILRCKYDAQVKGQDKLRLRLQKCLIYIKYCVK